MGKKAKRQEQNSDDEYTPQEHDGSKSYVSAKQAARREAAEASRGGAGGQTKHQGGLPDSDGEEQIGKKAGKRKRQGGQQLEEFEEEESKEVAKQAAFVDTGDARDLQKDLEEHFEGVGKKNTRKKKQKGETNLYGGAQDAELAAAFDEGADSDEVHAKKGGKHKKDKDRKNKKGKNKQEQQSDAEEEKKQEEGEQNEEEEEAEKKEGEMPLTVIYCKKCGLPPEYCSFGQKDISACKEWLQSNHPALASEIYGEPEGEAGDKAKEESKDGEEEKKDGDGEAAEAKPKKKVKFGKNQADQGVIHVYKLKRGGRKVVCQMTGFEYYSKDLKGLASKFGKRFSCGCNVAQDDLYGECISVQGDVEDKLLEYLETDKDMRELAIPLEKIKFADMGNKKGRKQAPKPAAK